MKKSRKQQLFDTLVKLSEIYVQQHLKKIAILEQSKSRLLKQKNSLSDAMEQYQKLPVHENISSILNRKAFMQNITEALNRTEEEIQKVSDALLHSWEEWRQTTQTQKAYEKLAEKALEEHLLVLQKRERKIEDEIAALQTLQKHSRTESVNN